MDWKNRNKPHIVYALMLNGKAIYVGCCMNTEKRERAHRRLKKFDYLIVIKKYDNKFDALVAENAIIRFMSLFEKGQFLNALYHDLINLKMVQEVYFSNKKEREVSNE